MTVRCARAGMLWWVISLGVKFDATISDGAIGSTSHKRLIWI